MIVLHSSLRNIEKTVIVAYFVYSNGVPLSTSDVDKGLADPEHFEELKALGLSSIVSVGSLVDSFVKMRASCVSMTQIDINGLRKDCSPVS